MNETTARRGMMGWTTAALFAVAGAHPALAQDKPICGPEVKEEIAKVLSEQKDPESPEALAQQDELYKKFQYCAADGEVLSQTEFGHAGDAYCGKLTYLGSTFFERMPCCGYDPQKKLFGCPVEVRQPFGFGSAPFPGSFERVLTCVDLGGGYVPVAYDDVHLANAVSGQPNWYFAVIARANERLTRLPLDGKTLRARSILSWGLVPRHCNYEPIWGNVLDYQIRLDP